MTSLNIFDSIPIIFQPRYLRNGIKFRNLKQHIFNTNDLVWLCNEINKINPKWGHQIVSIKSISKRYHLPIFGIRLWLKNLNHNYVFKCY
jgi:hypothetical protein